MSYHDVHTRHCCIAHGCKYGEEDCTVVTGLHPQDYPCETCERFPDARVMKVLDKGKPTFEQVVHDLQVRFHENRRLNEKGLDGNTNRQTVISEQELQVLISTSEYLANVKKYLEKSEEPFYKAMEILAVIAGTKNQSLEEL